MIAGLVIRVVVAALCLGYGVSLLRVARRMRVRWAAQQEGLARAEAWWSRTQGGPFDQERGEVPDDVVAFLGPNGPRTQLRTPRPGQERWVWGWILVVIATFVLASVAAQLSHATA